MLFSERKPRERLNSSSDSDSEAEVRKPVAVPVKCLNFKCSTFSMPKNSSDDLFVLDTNPSVMADGAADNIDGEQSKATESSSKPKRMNRKQNENETVEVLSESTKELLAKSIIKPGFEKAIGEGHLPLSMRAAKRQRKAEKERTKGTEWFNLPASELTEERRRDLELLQMRNTLYTSSRYRKADRKTIPKYFQVGTVIESKADFYSSRVPRKQRRQTMAEELLGDMELLTRQKRIHQEIKAKEAMAKRRASNSMQKYRLRRHKKRK